MNRLGIVISLATFLALLAAGLAPSTARADESRPCSLHAVIHHLSERDAPSASYTLDDADLGSVSVTESEIVTQSRPQTSIGAWKTVEPEVRNLDLDDPPTALINRRRLEPPAGEISTVRGNPSDFRSLPKSSSDKKLEHIDGIPIAGHERDPYTTPLRRGLYRDPKDTPPIPEEYKFNHDLPDDKPIERVELKDFQITHTARSLYLENALKKAGPKNAMTFLAAGGYSRVYVIHPRIPPSLRSKMASVRRKKGHKKAKEVLVGWIKKNATEVIKFQRVESVDSPHFKKLKRLDQRKYEDILAQHRKSKLMIETHLTMEQLLKQEVKRATFQGKPLLRVGEIISTPEELALGIIRQRLARGPTLAELQHMIYVLRQVKQDPKKLTAWERKIILPQARETLTGMDIDLLEKRILAIEQFYRDTHYKALQLRIDLKLATLSNTSALNVFKAHPQKKFYHLIGFDYNHGQNVILDLDTGDFFVIDL